MEDTIVGDDLGQLKLIAFEPEKLRTWRPNTLNKSQGITALAHVDLEPRDIFDQCSEINSYIVANSGRKGFLVGRRNGSIEHLDYPGAFLRTNIHPTHLATLPGPICLISPLSGHRILALAKTGHGIVFKFEGLPIVTVNYAKVSLREPTSNRESNPPNVLSAFKLPGDEIHAACVSQIKGNYLAVTDHRKSPYIIDIYTLEVVFVAKVPRDSKPYLFGPLKQAKAMRFLDNLPTCLLVVAYQCGRVRVYHVDCESQDHVLEFMGILPKGVITSMDVEPAYYFETWDKEKLKDGFEDWLSIWQAKEERQQLPMSYVTAKPYQEYGPPKTPKLPANPVMVWWRAASPPLLKCYEKPRFPKEKYDEAAYHQRMLIADNLGKLYKFAVVVREKEVKETEDMETDYDDCDIKIDYKKDTAVIESRPELGRMTLVGGQDNCKYELSALIVKSLWVSPDAITSIAYSRRLDVSDRDLLLTVDNADRRQVVLARAHPSIIRAFDSLCQRLISRFIIPHLS